MFYAPTYCPGSLCDPCIVAVGNLAIVGVDWSRSGYPGPHVALEWSSSDGPLYQLVGVSIIYTIHAQDKSLAPISTVFTVEGEVTYTGAGSGAFLPLPLTPLALEINYSARLPMYAGSFFGYSLFVEASVTGPGNPSALLGLTSGPNFIVTKDDGSTFNIPYGA